MKQDISGKEDIQFIVTKFYNKLLNDSSINHFFEHMMATESLSHHIEIVTDFWNGILFNTIDYQRNAMEPHLTLHKKIPFKNVHFKIWLHHFTTTIDAYFEGEKALLAKTRAISIATIIEIKTIAEKSNEMDIP